jgi:repressor LexA
MERLTPKQENFYKTLKRFFEENKKSPTISELMGLMRASSPRAITQYLEALERKGLVVRSRNVMRGIALAEPQRQTAVIPVVSSAGCDNLATMAEQIFGEFVCVAKDLLRGMDPKRIVGIRAVGNSMDEAGIQEGDYVLVESTEGVEQDDLVVAIIDGMAVIKKLDIANNAVILRPVSSDPRYKPIILNRDFKIFGRVLEIIRHPQKGELEIVPLV